MIVSYTLSDLTTTTHFFILKSNLILILGLKYPRILVSTIKPMSAVYSLNTLGGQPLVSGSASTFLLKTYALILDIILLFHNTKHIHDHNVFGMNT
jgi:hypothetical protein